MEILGKLQEIMREVFDDETLVITRETTAADVEDWDSLTHITLIVTVEKRLGVRFEHREIERLKNVGEFVDLLGAKLKA